MSFRILGEPFKTLGGVRGGILGGGSGGLSAVQFLFRDDFLIDEAAPLVSPRTAEPGPGTGSIVDTGNNLSIVGNRLVFLATGVSDPRYFTDLSFVRSAGLSFYAIANDLADNASGEFGWSINQTRALINTWGVSGGFLRAIFNNGIAIASLVALPDNTDVKTFSILRDAGGWFLHNFGDAWILDWISDVNVNTPLFICAGTTIAGRNHELGDCRISQLPAPWNSDFGIATDRLAGARSAGDTFVHEADCLIEFEVTTVPAAGQAEIRFRIQDATNYWQVTIDSAGDLDLDEVVAGVPTQRGTSAAVIANGDRVVIIADDETIRVFEDNVLRITYALAANFKFETDGELEDEGAGGSESDIVTWPRTITGEAGNPLDRVANA